MKSLLVVFSHGKESGPTGSKIQALMKVAERHDAEVLSVDYRYHHGTEQDPDSPSEADRRVAQLLTTALPKHQQLVLVGSSMGGYVSTMASRQLATDALFLMAPAFYQPGYAAQDPMPHARKTLVVHGWSDDVIPPENSVRFSKRHNCALHLLDGDHRLNAAMPSIEMLFDMFLHDIMTDQLLPKARKLILQQENPSVAFLQRNFMIGHSHALRLMQSLEGDIVTVPNADGWRRMLHSGNRSPSDPQSPDYKSDELLT